MTDTFGAEGWLADVIIQTEGQSDYADLPSALKVLMESLRARIDDEDGDPDEEEAPGEPTTYRAKLRQMLGHLEDSAPEDWDSYIDVVTQPEIYLGEPSESTRVTLAEVDGRKRAIHWLADNPLSLKGAEIRKVLARIDFSEAS